MKIWDFPMETPDVVSSQLKDCRLDIDYGGGNGRCELCHKNDATHIFNIGATMHHLCGECFKCMLNEFMDKIGNI